MARSVRYIGTFVIERCALCIGHWRRCSERPLAPDQTLDIYSTGKRWMWRFQHIDGQSEINELHVPLGRPVKVIFTSEDVLHSLYLPAFSVKAGARTAAVPAAWLRELPPE
jgi:cytochrome c oxidase subunit 2